MSSNAHNCNYYPLTQDFLHHIPDDDYDSDYSDNDVVAFDFDAPMAPLPGAVEDIIQKTPHLLERKSVLEQVGGIFLFDFVNVHILGIEGFCIYLLNNYSILF